MAMSMHLDIASAEEQLFSGRCELLIARAAHGDIGIAPQHTPFLSTLEPGVVRVIMQGGNEETFYVSGGFIEVQPETITILADTAQRAGDIDEAAASEARKAAEDAMSNRDTDFDFSRAQAQLAEAAAKLRAIQNLRNKAKR